MDSPVEADIVVGVPESGNAAAMGYAMESGIPYGTAFVKNSYVGRTFIKPKQSTRESSVKIKLNVLREAVAGKRVIMIDDSIVRGTTSDRIVKMLRDAGATEVHMRVSSPPFLYPCYFGTDVPAREQLIAYNRSVEEIRQVIGRALKDGKMTIHDVDLVVMAGGSSKMPLIQKYIRHLFHKAPMVQGNCDELIALGLGLVCGVKERKEEIKDYILTDICPFSLGVATINEADPDRAYMANIINRNTVLPCSRVRRFYTASDQQDYVVVEVHQGENTYAQDNLLLGKIEISVPPKPKGKEAVDVRFTYDINGILVVDTRVVSTGVVKTHIISQKIPEAELEERVRELEKLKVHPRDLSENQQMMERLEALYQEVYPEQKEQVQQMIRTFEEFLDGQNPRQIQGYRRYLEKAVSVLEYYDPFEEEFDASESDWDLWDEEEAQDPDNEETDEEEFWKKEGDDHSWTS